MSMTTTRQRRSTAEVRRLLLAAAQELFAQRGFSGATTREIAARAGVTEQVLFNQFGSKARLFDATVLQPFEAFARHRLQAWRDVPLGDLDPEEMLSSYIEDLYQLVLENRSLFRAVGEDRFGEPVQLILERLDQVATEMAALHGYRFDVPVGVRIVFAATTTLALHQDTLLPANTTTAILSELKATLVTGLLHRP
jgi:AcrR family transcriptional regulator